MSVLEKIDDIICRSLKNEVAEFIAERFGLDHREVSEAMADYLQAKPTRVISVLLPSDNFKPAAVKPPTKTEETPQLVKIGCRFKLIKGPRKGQACNGVVKNGQEFCTKHKDKNKASPEE